MMNVTKYIWKNGKMIPWAEATTHVLNHSLHYGSAVFEGIRFYETESGPAIFKLDEHIDRLFYSADAVGMKLPFTVDEIQDACVETVAINEIASGYIRPLFYYGYGSMIVVPNDQLPVEAVIACWPWGGYLGAKAVDLKTSEYIRIHPKSSKVDAKISGHYVNSIVAGLAIKNTHYHEVLLLDDQGYVAEGSAENIFYVKDGELFTTPIGTILDGITRRTVIDIAKELHIPVNERYFTPQEFLQSDEAFCTGTAVEVTAIRSLDDQLIGDGDPGPITAKIKQFYESVVCGKTEKFKSALTYLSFKKSII